MWGAFALGLLLAGVAGAAEPSAAEHLRAGRMELALQAGAGERLDGAAMLTRARIWAALGQGRRAAAWERAAVEAGTVGTVPPVQPRIDEVPGSPELGSLTAVRRDLADGRCALAEARGLEGLSARPTAAGWQALGDARRCNQRSAEAAWAYREALALGAPVGALLDELRAGLGSLRYAGLPPGGVVELLREGDWIPGDSGVLPDLPVATPLTTRVRAPLHPARLYTVALGFAGEHRTVAADLEPVDSVTVTVDEPGERLILRGVDGFDVAADRPALELPRGPIQLLATGRYGPVSAVLDGAAPLTIDAEAWRPAALRIDGVPAGATVRVFCEGVDPPVERLVQLDNDGRIEPRGGLRVAPEVLVRGLVGGRAGVVVEHPRLGLLVTEAVLRADRQEVLELDTSSLEGAAAIAGAWSRHQQEERRARRAGTLGTLVPLSTAAGAAVLSAALWAGAVQQGQRAAAARDGALAGLTPPGERSWYELNLAALQQERGLIAGGAITAGLAGAGVVVGGVFGATGRRSVPAWDPDAVGRAAD